MLTYAFDIVQTQKKPYKTDRPPGKAILVLYKEIKDLWEERKGTYLLA